MSASQAWVLRCDYDTSMIKPQRVCPRVWVDRAGTAATNEWQARLRASSEGWTHEEGDPPWQAGREPSDFCPEHPNGRALPQREARS